MRWLLAIVVVLPAALLVVGAVRGRVQVRSCCAVDAAHDKRMIAALATDEPGARDGVSGAAGTQTVRPVDAPVVRGDRAAS
jgi:hypothetical protein